MAIMIDQKPKYHGEQSVWEMLEKNLPNEVVVYNSRVVEGKEYDFCLLLDGYGLVVLEVKGWQPGTFVIENNSTIRLRGYSEPQSSPLSQARNYQFSILNQLQSRLGLRPKVVSLAAFPFLRRDDLIDSGLLGMMNPDEVLTVEDLAAPETLLGKIKNRLEYTKVKNSQTLNGYEVQRIRELWEGTKPSDRIEEKACYSHMHCFPQQITEHEARKIVGEYFEGIKQIVFSPSAEDAYKLAELLEASFKDRNLAANGLNLVLNLQESGIQTSEQGFKIFNFDFYVCPEKAAGGSCWEVVDGIDYQQYEERLKKLSLYTSFNFEQYLVEHAKANENIVVKAGAGTGKSFTLVSRIAYLLHMPDSGLDQIADQLVLITFTNDAADSVKRRLEKLFQNYYLLTGNPQYLTYVSQIPASHISTIHSFIFELLRLVPHITGLSTDFSIGESEWDRSQLYDQYLREFMAQKVLEQGEQYRQKLPVPYYEINRTLLGLANTLKQKSVYIPDLTDESFGKITSPFFEDAPELVMKVMLPAETEYNKRIRQRNQLPLSHLISELYHCLKTDPQALAGAPFRYVFIDEFQDTDNLQIDLFSILLQTAKQPCNLFIVGDLKQSIYRFRGATMSAFDLMEKKIGGSWIEFHLRKNYRTDRHLLDEMHDIFLNMGEGELIPYESGKDRLTGVKQLNPPFEKGISGLEYMKGLEGKDWPDVLASVITKELGWRSNAEVPPRLSSEMNTIAVLVRTNFEVNEVVKAMRKKGIEVQTDHPENLFSSPALLDFYRLVQAASDPESLVSLTNLIQTNLVESSFDYALLREREKKESLVILQNEISRYLERKTEVSWENWLIQLNRKPVLHILFTMFLRLEPWDLYTASFSKKDEYLRGFYELQELLCTVFKKQSPSITQLREYLEIQVTTGKKRYLKKAAEPENQPKVIVRTIHKSKGLEYGTVILPYMERPMDMEKDSYLDVTVSNHEIGISFSFPTFKGDRISKVLVSNSFYDAMSSQAEMKMEEARVLYVALTRAIKNVYWIKSSQDNTQLNWRQLMEVEDEH